MRNLLFSLLLMFSGLAQAATFDQGHEQWSTLLARHVAWDAVGFASAVDYRGFKRDEADLDRYLGCFRQCRATSTTAGAGRNSWLS